MEDLFRNGALLGGLLGLALLGWRTRWRLHALGLALTIGVPLAIGLETLAGSLGAGVPLRPGLVLLCWVGFARLAVGAGGPRLKGPAWLITPLLGAGLGDWGAALLLAPLAPGPAVAGRWVLGAMAGALVATHGTPAFLVLGGPQGVAWLALGLWILSAPPGRLDHQGSGAVTGIVTAVALGAWLVPALALSILAVGCAALLTHAQRSPLHPLGRDLAVLALLVGFVWLERHGGLLQDLRWGLEMLLREGGDLGAPAVTLIGAAAATLGGEYGLSLVAAGALDTAVVLDPPEVRPALATGLALGGLGPLVLAGALRPVLLRWLLGVALGVSWVACTLA